MSSGNVIVATLTRAAFAPFGQVLETEGAEHFTINRGATERFHDLAQLEFGGPNARPIISIFQGSGFTLPYALQMMERHPLGSQAFMPLSPRPFLVTVALDDNGKPGTPRAFVTAPGQGINIARNVWHGTLTPLDEPAEFLVVDRGGEGNNLEEHVFDAPLMIEAPGR
jgi:ureidoglycolate lyase